MRFGIRTSDVRREVQRARAEHVKRRRKAALLATDRASKDAQGDVRAKMRSVGLGKLDRAVAQTSALKKGQKDRDAYGVVFAKGGDESRAGQALQAYTKGARIRPIRGRWLWIGTKAMAKRISRYKATPALYVKAGSPLGELKYAVLSPKRAIAYVENVGIRVKTGRARPLPKRRSKATVPTKRVILFEGIPFTYRAARFNQVTIVGRRSRQMPTKYLPEAYAEVSR